MDRGARSGGTGAASSASSTEGRLRPASLETSSRIPTGHAMPHDQAPHRRGPELPRKPTLVGPLLHAVVNPDLPQYADKAMQIVPSLNRWRSLPSRRPGGCSRASVRSLHLPAAVRLACRTDGSARAGKLSQGSGVLRPGPNDGHPSAYHGAHGDAKESDAAGVRDRGFQDVRGKRSRSPEADNPDLRRQLLWEVEHPPGRSLLARAWWPRTGSSCSRRKGQDVDLGSFREFIFNHDASRALQFHFDLAPFPTRRIRSVPDPSVEFSFRYSEKSRSVELARLGLNAFGGPLASFVWSPPPQEQEGLPPHTSLDRRPSALQFANQLRLGAVDWGKRVLASVLADRVGHGADYEAGTRCDCGNESAATTRTSFAHLCAALGPWWPDS